MLLDFAKGHGTRNDFVVFADPDNLLDLTAEQVTFLCDRRGGVGGDGILRAVRALEVIELTGSYTSTLPGWNYAVGDVLQYGLEVPRDLLDARIEARVHQMWDDGFVDEVRGLVDRGIREGRTAWRALGYRQVLAFLDGELTEAEALQATIAGTRRFSRKQMGWFRRDPRIVWLSADDDAAATMASALRGRVLLGS